jgi:hypothetical protein
LERGDNRCHRVAFLEDLIQMLRASLQQGIHIILLTDGNSNMKNSDLQVTLQGLDMKEACLTRNGNNGSGGTDACGLTLPSIRHLGIIFPL